MLQASSSHSTGSHRSSLSSSNLEISSFHPFNPFGVSVILTNYIQAGLRAHELRTKSKQQLEDELLALKQELASLKVQKLQKPSLPKITTVRKNIARVLTIININQRESVRAFYAGKKYQPKDLRAKKTRALRRTLTKFEASQITLKQQKKNIAFPQRKYAIKA